MQSDARRRKCDEKDKPPMNTTNDIECDRPSLGYLRCVRKCHRCYKREELGSPSACLVDKECMCLGKPPNDTAPTTPVPEVTTQEITTPVPPEVTTTGQLAHFLKSSCRVIDYHHYCQTAFSNTYFTFISLNL